MELPQPPEDLALHSMGLTSSSGVPRCSGSVDRSNITLHYHYWQQVVLLSNGQWTTSVHSLVCPRFTEILTSRLRSVPRVLTTSCRHFSVTWLHCRTTSVSHRLMQLTLQRTGRQLAHPV